MREEAWGGITHTRVVRPPYAHQLGRRSHKHSSRFISVTQPERERRVRGASTHSAKECTEALAANEVVLEVEGGEVHTLHERGREGLELCVAPTAPLVVERAHVPEGAAERACVQLAQ
jgi:hypothetical protein